eukprot:CAMPEP_0170495150 /NCGR_PEP_ID=MMETSP0208-20121228/15044_1 /TAXON_ID=197538 /ORGANISM="Strombidium inclinatum, Strain S3" /LENGTH=136 /DNA_ID=CAMNT_0010771297 /DNA_START=92 /DNA_END=499 /DNA_ORIENTATION=-
MGADNLESLDTLDDLEALEKSDKFRRAQLMTMMSSKVKNIYAKFKDLQEVNALEVGFLQQQVDLLNKRIKISEHLDATMKKVKIDHSEFEASQKQTIVSQKEELEKQIEAREAWVDKGFEYLRDSVKYSLGRVISN